MLIQTFELHATMLRSVVCFENPREGYFSLSESSVGKNARLIPAWL